MSSPAVRLRGVVFTKPIVVEFMLDELGYTDTHDLSNIRVLEPAAGEGAFVLEMARRLRRSARRFNFSFEAALGNITAVEISADHLTALQNRLREEGISVAHLNLHRLDFFDFTSDTRYDLVIGNPPYVRWDNLDATYRTRLRRWKTFSGRCDLYVPFFEKGLQHLSKAGRLSYLCSNRWFKAAYGKRLRQLVTGAFGVERILDLEKCNPFTSEVLGYPAILTLTRTPVSTTRYQRLDTLEFGQLPTAQKIMLQPTASMGWVFDNSLLAIQDSSRYTRITDQGYQIRIGIATGRDEVFIGSDLQKQVETSRLVPLLKAKDLLPNRSSSNLMVINCFENGKLIDLNAYPKLKQYLNKSEPQLRRRYIARKNPKAWFRTIDKIRMEDIDRPKILLPDINGSEEIRLDGVGYYPHHNIYYIVGPDLDNLQLLGGVLSSNLVRHQLHAMSNKMNGGYPRWQSQYLKRLLIPDLKNLSDTWRARMSTAYREGDYTTINRMMEPSELDANCTQKREAGLLF